MSSDQWYSAVAPGRLDVMGGIADYSGSLVLQMPIARFTTARVRLRKDLVCTFRSTTTTGELKRAEYTYEGLTALQESGRLRLSDEDSWIAYVIGCALLLDEQLGIAFHGADFEIYSDVPVGKGVSSSASLEVATMKALAEAFGVAFESTELARLAQRVENEIVGAPCGLMDQLAVEHGNPGRILPIVCRPDQLLPEIPIPDGVFVCGIDSGTRHHVGGSAYGDVRAAAFMGYTIIALESGASREDIERARITGDWTALPYQGYLCNISTDEFYGQIESHLPQSMPGSDFMEMYGQTIDRFTEVRPDGHYEIASCTAHPVLENERIHEFMDLLRKVNMADNSADQAGLLKSMGKLMYQSHHGYGYCGLASPRTDEMVIAAVELESEGIYGARITGGGSGGTVCVLAFGEKGLQSVRDLHKHFCEKYNEQLELFGCEMQDAGR